MAQDYIAMYHKGHTLIGINQVLALLKWDVPSGMRRQMRLYAKAWLITYKVKARETYMSQRYLNHWYEDDVIAAIEKHGTSQCVITTKS